MTGIDLQLNSAVKALTRIQAIPRGTVLSEKQIKTTESHLKNTDRVRTILSDYFERKGKSEDEKAIALDMMMYERQCFLRLKLAHFDKARVKKRTEQLERAFGVFEQQSRLLYKSLSLSVEDLFRPFDI